MAMSREERERENWRYENEPHMNGLTRSQFDDLPEEQRERHCQIMMQVPATVLGYWKTCDLSACRRARQCRGFLSRAQRESGQYHRSYPPCAGLRGRRQPEMLAALDHCDHLFDANLRPMAGPSGAQRSFGRKSGA
ncbi:hypothetical protein J2858_001019 [Neorhizobium galegae]|uniref:hypothetical protein n=1 Tax=Neorhizobium galegae TaxID=399 RepID=UPI001AE2109F|nr:hypothetical protein [Neorhizobium galegae]MBP2548126.1 hypothetical protein [Neorhizobium galegae]